MRRRVGRGWRVVVLIGIVLLSAPAVQAQGGTPTAPVTTAPITIEGVALRQVLDAPVPVYLTSTIDDEKARWMRDAVAIALDAVPRVTGLPLPQQRLEFYLFSDPREMASLSGQLLRASGPRVAPECFALAVSGTPRRGIYCQADAWESAAQALDYVVHELTHQVEQGDGAQRRELAQWFNEGLAEHIQQLVLREHQPSYAARDRWLREARVASALHTDRLPRLRELTSNTRWQQAAANGWGGLLYAHSSLVVAWLADQYGLDRVIEVVRRTSSPLRFDEVFQEVLGQSVGEAERAARATFEAELLPRYPKGVTVFESDDPSEKALHFAVVGFQPREWLSKEYRYVNGAPADGVGATGTQPESERTDLSGFATWRWTRTSALPPGLPPRVELTVRGSEGSLATQSATLPPGP
ncbi:MAG: hypothetical protein IRZ14_12705 [Chloroflexi bacterium]|nr:hypothetical protein [Chloroflexota bacterium]